MARSRTWFIIISMHLASYIVAQDLNKRGPQGFLGMRGKKLTDDSIEQFYKRKPQFFVGVKGKKTLYDMLKSPEYYYKRAPMGFMGVRGKKESIEDYGYYPESFEYVPKRGSLIGQIDYQSNGNNVEDFPFLNDVLTDYLSKLERENAVTESNEGPDVERITNEVDKRAGSIHQFFGVRGKKSIEKRPYDVSFRGKFIGVRGKKDVKNSGAQEIKFLLENGPLPKRKSQMGFIGMRGKKWTDGMLML